VNKPFINRYDAKKKKADMISMVISFIIAFLIGFIMRFILGYIGWTSIEFFQVFDTIYFAFAVMTTVSLPLYKIFFTKFDRNNLLFDTSESKKNWLKRSSLLICVSWVIYILFLSIDLLNIPLGSILPYSIIAPTFDPFLLGFQWAFFALLIFKGLTILINALLPQKLRPAKDVADSSMTFGSFVAFGVWSLQAFIFEIYLSRLFEITLFEQDIRILAVVVGIIYIISYFMSMKYIYLPKAIEAEKKLMNEVSQLEGIQKKIEDNVTLDVKDLKTYFYTEEGVVHAVENVSFKIYEGEVLGLVGETGCGKSVTALSILQLIQPPGKIINGRILFEGEDLLKKTESEICSFRGNKLTMIFQDPLNSLNPVYTVGKQITEVYLLHMQKELLKVVDKNAGKIKEQEDLINNNAKQIKIINQKKIAPARDTKGKELNRLNDLFASQEVLKAKLQDLKKFGSIYSTAREWGVELLKNLNIPAPEQIIDRYPHELSGGMRQRIQIAMGLACSPKLLIADEPTTALDVTIQNQILKLMKNLKNQMGTSILFITHDLGIISKMCDRVAVMYSGSVVESGVTEKIFTKPYHPYTKGLLAAIPVEGKEDIELSIIPGMVPNLIYPPSGCRFHPRCQFKFEPCDNIIPTDINIEENYTVACHLYDLKYKNKIEELMK
jgi:peptide/nickel transport system ATP-binding protein